MPSMAFMVPYCFIQLTDQTQLPCESLSLTPESNAGKKWEKAPNNPFECVQSWHCVKFFTNTYKNFIFLAHRSEASWAALTPTSYGYAIEGGSEINVTEFIYKNFPTFIIIQMNDIQRKIVVCNKKSYIDVLLFFVDIKILFFLFVLCTQHTLSKSTELFLAFIRRSYTRSLILSRIFFILHEFLLFFASFCSWCMGIIILCVMIRS